MARRVVAGLLAAALASVAADGNATTARAVSPVAEELVRLGVFDRVVVVCEAGSASPIRLTRRADDDCRRHGPGGGAWPDDLQDRVVVVGDTHGQLADWLWILRSHGPPNAENVYVINGDVADRGRHAVEIFLLIFSYPNLFGPSMSVSSEVGIPWICGVLTE